MSGLTGPVIDFGLLIIGAMVLGGVALVLRQPLILAYIAAGVLLGSHGFGLIHDPQYLAEVSGDLGIAFLLFVVGLELSFKKMLEVRNVVTFGTLAQSILFVIVGMFLGYFLGFTLLESVYLGLGIAFASTLLIVKSLGERNMIDTTPGRIMVGSLVFEDILVIVSISVLGVLAGAEPTGLVKWFVHLPGLSLIPYIGNIALVFGAALLFGLALLVNRFVARYLFRFFSANPEMLFVSSLGFLFVMAFAASELGYSVAIGAFIAGVILANTDQYLEVLSKIKTLATFFALLFFATLGFQVSFESLAQLVVPVVAITAVVLFIKPIIVAFMVRLFGYDKRTSLAVGLHFSQISEFSLILIAFGIGYGQVRQEMLTIFVMVLLVSFLVSSYYAKFSGNIIAWLQRRFKSLSPDEQAIAEQLATQHATVVVYGVDHIDEQLLDDITRTGQAIIVDPEPSNVDFLRQKGVPCLLGSLANEEILEKLDFKHIQVVLSTVNDFEENLFVAEHIHQHDPTTIYICPAAKVKEALELYQHGATYVRLTSFVEDAAIHAVLFSRDRQQLEDVRHKQIERLRRIASRKEGAVDIDDFMTSLAEQHLAVGRQAFQKTTRPVFEEVDKFVRSFRKWK